MELSSINYNKKSSKNFIDENSIKSIDYSVNNHSNIKKCFSKIDNFLKKRESSLDEIFDKDYSSKGYYPFYSKSKDNIIFFPPKSDIF